MYKITLRETGRLLDITSEPRFIAKNRKGLWKKCSEEKAQAVAVNSIPYALSEEMPVVWPTTDEDGNEIGEEAAPVVVVSSISDGAYTMELLGTTDGHTDEIDDLNAGVMELSDAQAQTTNDLEAALMEQADASAGTSDDLSAALMELSDITAQLMERVDALEGKEGE